MSNDVQDEIEEIEAILTDADLESDDATVWFRHGFGYEDVKTFLSIGIIDADTAKAIHLLDIEPAQLVKTREQTIKKRTRRG